MSKDKACISAVKEVCQRCHLYKENCGMLDYPDQCIASGRYIEGYHQAEKDLELGWEEIYSILYFEREVLREFGNEEHSNEEICKEVLRRFYEQRNEDKNI